MRLFALLLAACLSVWGADTALLTLADGDQKPIVIKKEALESLPATILTDLPMVCASGAQKAPPATYKGVKLSRLLKFLNLEAHPHREQNRMAVMVRGSDGYSVLFGYRDLTNTKEGESVIVVYEKDGNALDEREGPIALISGSDLITGPRHVRQAVRIDALVIP